jgi:hypothetical protein
MIISALYLDYIEWLKPPGADWAGHFHLRQLPAVLLDFLAAAAPPSAQKGADSRHADCGDRL